MSFGRKGLAPGQAAPSPGGGFGRAPTSAQVVAGVGAGGPLDSGAATDSAQDPDDVAAKREAFVATERSLSGQPVIPRPRAPNPDPLINLRNMSRPTARPAQPLQAESVEASGLTARQEAEIRAAARGMASGLPASRYGSGNSGSSTKIFGAPASRNVGLAYVFWFFLGQFSLHRFYCGQTESAFIQMGLWIFSLVTLFVFIPIGLFGLLIWFCWIVGDLFMIPGMLSKFQAEYDDSSVFS